MISLEICALPYNKPKYKYKYKLTSWDGIELKEVDKVNLIHNNEISVYLDEYRDFNCSLEIEL